VGHPSCNLVRKQSDSVTIVSSSCYTSTHCGISPVILAFLAGSESFPRAICFRLCVQGRLYRLPSDTAQSLSSFAASRPQGDCPKLSRGRTWLLTHREEGDERWWPWLWLDLSLHVSKEMMDGGPGDTLRLHAEAVWTSSDPWADKHELPPFDWCSRKPPGHPIMLLESQQPSP
jgi:hypothetical protein